MQLASKPQPEGLGTKISYGTLFRFHNRERQKQALARLQPAVPSAADILNAGPGVLANLKENTLRILEQKSFEAVQDPDFCLNDNPYAAKLTLKLMEMRLRDKWSTLLKPGN